MDELGSNQIQNMEGADAVRLFEMEVEHCERTLPDAAGLRFVDSLSLMLHREDNPVSAPTTPFPNTPAEVLEKVAEARQHLSMGAVVVVGAGLSLDARFPLTPGLNALLWDALDESASAKAAVAQRLKLPIDSGKALVGDEWSRAQVAWEVVETDASARLRLQLQFSNLDRERVRLPSLAHEALARLVHAGVVEVVISLNWDTALEAAYERLYGVSIPRGVLVKPHGDAANPEGRWTLPHEDGRAPKSLLDDISELKRGHARTLLVVGYSERDRVVVEDIIEPLDNSWRTIRVGPSVAGAHDLAATAEAVLPLLAEPSAHLEDTAAWHSISFTGGRDIRSALRGERLDPRDIAACPQLGEVSALVEALLVDRAVVLNGPTGSGKSISAYQALHRMASKDYEVLRLRDSVRNRPPRMWIQDLRGFPHQKVLFIDDAQDMSADAVRELCEVADEHTRVLVAGIDHVAGGIRTIRLGSKTAVNHLANWVREQRSLLFPLVRELDDHVGSYEDGPEFNRRIDLAADEPTAWQFFYVLTGGWRRIRRQAIELRDAERADLAWLALSVAQIAGVDAGVSRETLLDYVQVLGRTSEWAGRSLDTLKARRLVIEVDGRFRCPHLRTAYLVLNWMLHPPQWNPAAIDRPHVPPIASATQPLASVAKGHPQSGPVIQPVPDVSHTDQEADRDAACRVVTHALESPRTPLRGLSWLAGTSTPGDIQHMLRWKGVLDADRSVALARRALQTSARGDVAAAAVLLSDSLPWGPNEPSPLSAIPGHEEQLRAWLGAISPESAWAISKLVNNLYNHDRDYARTVISYADPARVANLVPRGGWPHSVSTGEALDRLCGLGSAEFRQAVAAEMDPEEFAHMFANPDPAFWRTPALIADIVVANSSLALELLHQSASRLAGEFTRDPLVNWNSMFEMVMRLGYGPAFLRGGRRPPRACGTALRTFTRALDVDTVAQVLSRPTPLWGVYNFSAFVDLLDECDTRTLNGVLDRVDLTCFEEALRTTAGGETTAYYVAARVHERRPVEVHEMLDRLEPAFDELEPLVAYVAPDVAVRSLLRGLPLDLGLEQHQWTFAAQIVGRLASVNRQVAREVLEANSSAMSLGLQAKNHSDPWKGLRDFVPVCDMVAPPLLDEVIRSLPAGAVASWDRGLRRPQKYHSSRRADIEPLVARAIRADGPCAVEAAELHRRFPSLGVNRPH